MGLHKYEMLSQCVAVWLGVQCKLTYTYEQIGLDSSLVAIKMRARCQRFVPVNIFIGKSFSEYERLM